MARILIIEGEPLICDSVRRLLVYDGHEVETAASRQAGLTQFREGGFDLTIVDYEMGCRHGDELAAAIKTLDPNQPIALITAFAEALQAAGTPLAAVDLVISKPFGLETLRLAVTKLLTKP